MSVNSNGSARRPSAKNVSRVEVFIPLVIAIIGFVSLFASVIPEEGYEEIKLIVVLVSVLAAYHAFLEIVLGLRSQKQSNYLQTIKDECLQTINSQITACSAAINSCTIQAKYFSNSLHYNELMSLESEFHKTKCPNKEIWILTTCLQESKDSPTGRRALDIIHKNIMSGVQYYYLIPETREDDYHQFCNMLDSLHKKKASDKIQFKTCDKGFLIPYQYYDIILYSECNEDGHPSNSTKGYQCLSKDAIGDQNHYLEIELDTAKQLRTKIKKYFE